MKINNKPAEKKVVQMNYLFFCPELRNVGFKAHLAESWTEEQDRRLL